MLTLNIISQKCYDFHALFFFMMKFWARNGAKRIRRKL